MLIKAGKPHVYLTSTRGVEHLLLMLGGIPNLEKSDNIPKQRLFEGFGYNLCHGSCFCPPRKSPENNHSVSQRDQFTYHCPNADVCPTYTCGHGETTSIPDGSTCGLFSGISRTIGIIPMLSIIYVKLSGGGCTETTCQNHVPTSPKHPRWKSTLTPPYRDGEPIAIVGQHRAFGIKCG